MPLYISYILCVYIYIYNFLFGEHTITIYEILWANEIIIVMNPTHVLVQYKYMLDIVKPKQIR